MGVRASNVSFNGDPVDVELTSPYVVLIDPLALDGLRDRLQRVSQCPRSSSGAYSRSCPNRCGSVCTR